MTDSMADSKAVIARNLLLSGGLEELASACHKAGIKIILLKGSALFAYGLAEFDEREMTDIDLLVRAEDESRLESLLLSLGYSRMENSSQAFIRNAECGMRNAECDIFNSEIRTPNSEFPIHHSALRMPPAIIDVHTELRHLSDTAELFDNAVSIQAGTARVLVLSLEEMLVHVCSHPMLHHGCLLEKTIGDIKKIAEWGVRNAEWGIRNVEYGMQNGECGIDNPHSEILNPKSEIRNPKCKFLDWERIIEKSEKYGLDGLMCCVLAEAKKAGAAVSEDVLKRIKPKGARRLFLPFFKKAAESRQPVRFLEYLLPVLVRPSLALEYAFPDKEFLEKRYGSHSLLNILLRPFRILKNSLKS